MSLAKIAAELERIADSNPDRALADAAAVAALILATALATRDQGVLAFDLEDSLPCTEAVCGV